MHTHPLKNLWDTSVDLHVEVFPLFIHKWLQRFVVMEGHETPLVLLAGERYEVERHISNLQEARNG